MSKTSKTYKGMTISQVMNKVKHVRTSLGGGGNVSRRMEQPVMHKVNYSKLSFLIFHVLLPDKKGIFSGLWDTAILHLE